MWCVAMMNAGLALLGVLVLSLIALNGHFDRVLYTYYNPDAWLANLAKFRADRMEVGDHLLKLLIGDLLVPRTLSDLVLLAPLILAVALWGGVPGRPANYQLAFYAIRLGGIGVFQTWSAG